MVFASSAFEPFWKIINNKNLHPKKYPEKYFEFFGITKGAAGYTQLSLITTGKNYDAEDLTSRLTGLGLAKILMSVYSTRDWGVF